MILLCVRDVLTIFLLTWRMNEVYIYVYMHMIFNNLSKEGKDNILPKCIMFIVPQGPQAKNPVAERDKRM